MDWLVPVFLFYFAAPVICFYFFCRCCLLPFKWYWGFVYACLSFGLAKFTEGIELGGIAIISFEIFLLLFCGMFLVKAEAIQALTVSSLTISVLCISIGITQSLGYLFAAGLHGSSGYILKFIDIGITGFTIILLLLFYHFILKFFQSSMSVPHDSIFLLLAIPVLFISLVEQTISSAIYGNTIVWDADKGLISPTVNSAEILFLQVFACIGLFSALLAYKRLWLSIQSQQTIKLLEQQSHQQEIYVREAHLRYEKTQSFRHDIKNHLLVLGKLLKENNAQGAYAYLLNLEEISDTLSFPCHTGSTIVDALLSSKLATAKQQNIDISCSLKIPQSCCVKDIDWCIILSNAIDNAISACSLVPAAEPYILISGKQKGGFYFLHIENRCERMRELPEEGTGLCNIKAIAQKYGGMADREISEHIFTLNILLVISRQ